MRSRNTRHRPHFAPNRLTGSFIVIDPGTHETVAVVRLLRSVFF